MTNFHSALAERSRKNREIPNSWQEAFQQLTEHLKTLRGKGKRVIFLDELPWLTGPRSRFLQALDYFWNSYLSKEQIFREVTGTSKNVFLTLLTSQGITANAYAKELVDAETTTDCLFEEIL